jgi:hypothetical protein
MRLYAWVAFFLPDSPLAGESLYRTGDIRWQLEKEDAMSRPSAKEKDPNMRHQMEEEILKKVIKKYPGTRWADLAAWDLIDNKVCGEWQGDPKCPEKESEYYEHYAAEHPKSPRWAEALYDAMYRQVALVEMWNAKHDAKKSDEARRHATEIADRLIHQEVATDDISSSDYRNDAVRLLYLLQNNIPVFGYTPE